MEQYEYQALERVEKEHWFYQGKRAIVLWWLNVTKVVQAGELIVDAGAGTGELVQLLRQHPRTRMAQIEGVEYAAEARTIARDLRGIQLREGSILDLPYDDNSVRVAIALDVLEHVDDDSTAWSELLRITKPGGLILVNVPASMKLWSDWDVHLGHKRRYTMKSFRALLAPTMSQIQLLYLSYANAVGYLGIYLMRKLRHNQEGKPRAEDVIPLAPINFCLRTTFVLPVKLGLPIPFGSSILCAVRKK